MNLPAEFIKSLDTHFSQQEKEIFCESLMAESPISVRRHRRKTFKLSEENPVKWCELGYYLDKRPQFIFDPLFHGGSYYVQEASSMLLWQALDQYCKVDQNTTILDLCASPGGKSTLIANYIDGRGLLVSNEIIKSRAYTLKSNLAKEGYLNVLVTNNDPQDFTNLEGVFDMIMVDAPCSGEGMFRKDPKSINEWSLDNVALCTGRQKRILADVLPSLKDGGVIVYSTCTYNQHENMDNIKWICSQFDIQSLPLKIDSEWGVVQLEDRGHFGYQCFPHLVRGEGFRSCKKRQEIKMLIEFDLTKKPTFHYQKFRTQKSKNG
jgi:16S rRNA C967 or C1407 C5-methylase (RsmB/RsmF family)